MTIGLWVVTALRSYYGTRIIVHTETAAQQQSNGSYDARMASGETSLS